MSLGTVSNIVQPLTGKQLPYDFARDITPVSLLVKYVNVIAVHPSSPVKTLQELVAASKATAGGLSFATSGTGFSDHLSMELLVSRSGANMVHVPYKGGGPAATAVIGGQVPVLSGFALVTIPQIKAGKLRALAVTSANRLVALPDVPTVAESGFPGYESTGWIGIIVRSGTPPEIVTRLADEFARVSRLPDVKALEAAGTEVVGSTPEQFRGFLAEEEAKWAPVVRKIGLKLD